MGLFKRKKLKSLAPPFTYEPEELLHNYFDFLGIAVVKENEKYHFISKERVPEDFKKYSGMSTAGVYKGKITYDIPSESFSSVSEMIQVLYPVLEETVRKPLLQGYEDKNLKYEHFLDDYKINYGQKGLHWAVQKAFEELDDYKLCDLIINKAQTIDIEEFYQMYYDKDFDLMKALEELEPDGKQSVCVYNFGGKANEMVEITAVLGEDISGEKRREYSLALHHSYHRYETKWRLTEIGSINGVAYEDIEKELETLKDDKTMVNNVFYKGDFNGKYTIGELKKWTKNCDYEKAMEQAYLKVMGQNKGV